LPNDATRRQTLTRNAPFPPHAFPHAQARGELVVTAVFEKFTERAIKAVMLAQQEAKALRRPEVGVEHIVMGLVAEEAKKGGWLGTGVTIDSAREKAKEIVSFDKDRAARRTSTSEVPFSRGAKRVFEAALNNSTNMGMNYIAPEHIALAVAELDDESLVKYFEMLSTSRTFVKNEAERRLKTEKEKESGPAARPNTSLAPRQRQQQASQKDEKSPLNDFCFDLTQRARDEKIDPIIGRDEEVERVIQILARRSKNNPILLGEPGVGKTAIAEGLALRIVSGNVPEFLREKRVLSLDVGLLMAGAKERGELESRVTGLIKEIQDKKDVVLMIDEVHTLIGAGAVGKGGGGGMDISNMLKPPLARGELQCIGATTVDEHRKYIEKDAALERRFQPVMVEEPSEEDAIEILFGLRERYEAHHMCEITDDALIAAVQISSRYIADRFLPDKAIDLVDEAGSAARIKQYMAQKERRGEVDKATSMEAMEMWRALKQVSEAKEAAVRGLLFEEATLLRDREREVKTNLSKLGVKVDELTGDGAYGGAKVTVDEIEAVAAMWSGIPVQRMTLDEQAILANMDQDLQGSVIGQEEAVSAVSRSLRRTRCGLKDPNRPIASMLFAGPTGVGKTELTKRLAEKYFGSEDNMVRLDMSEYMERHSVSKLVGAPPGYVGFGQGGTLTEAVRRKPFTILLFDEIEKAHPDVFNILLQMMEDGRLTDSQGRVVSFKNCLIVLTSNVGSKVIAKGGGGLGFQLQDDDEEGSAEYKRIREKVLDELKNFFRPEMLNRLDEIVCFKQLEKESVQRIARLMLRETAGRMRLKGMEMALTASAMDKLLETGFDKEYGARPLRRAITSIIDDNLSEAMLRGVIHEGDVAVIDYDRSSDQFEAAAVDATAAAMGVKTFKGAANTENTYYGVSVTGVRGDPASQGFDVQWTSVGLDLEGEDFDIHRQVANNISTRSSSPVPVNELP